MSQYANEVLVLYTNFQEDHDKVTYEIFPFSSFYDARFHSLSFCIKLCLNNRFWNSKKFPEPCLHLRIKHSVYKQYTFCNINSHENICCLLHLAIFSYHVSHTNESSYTYPYYEGGGGKQIYESHFVSIYTGYDDKGFFLLHSKILSISKLWICTEILVKLQCTALDNKIYQTVND